MFYSSPEWAIIRDQVIKEEGWVCAECGSRIKTRTMLPLTIRNLEVNIPTLPFLEKTYVNFAAPAMLVKGQVNGLKFMCNRPC